MLTEFEPIFLDQLPLYSIWPEKILQADRDIIYPKDIVNIYREFEIDKYSYILSKLNGSFCTIDDVDNIFYENIADMPISIKGRLYKCNPLSGKIYLNSYLINEISSVYETGDSIVELGAGVGSLIIRLAKDDRFKGSTFFAGDFSSSSLKILDAVSINEGVEINTELYDLHAEINDLKIPKNSIIIFSFSLAYMIGQDASFWTRIMASKPKHVLIAEPIYQFYDKNSILGLFSKKYYEMNDYNKNILSSLQSASNLNILRIKKIDTNVIGLNPLCPVSLISIEPVFKI